MSEDEIDRAAQALQESATPKGPKRPNQPWALLTERSKDYWRAKVRETAPA